MVRLLYQLCVTSFVLIPFVQCTQPRTNYTYEEIYDKLFDRWNRTYDRRVRPFIGKGPVDVETFVYVLGIGTISEVTMTYDLDIYLRESWQDPRLIYDATQYNNLSKLSLHESLSDLLWVPDTFLPSAVMQKETQPNVKSATHKSLLRLNSSGFLLYSRRFSLTVQCPMDLTLYPFDRQVCRLSIESYGYDVTDVIYHWKDHRPVVINEELELPEFEITKHVIKRRNITLATGTYSRLEACFFFKRRAGYFFMALFFPATGIVAISWISLWMGKDNTFSDILQVILAVVFLNFSQNAVMPRVSYVKAIDVYIQSCLLFVFLSLIKLGLAKHLNDRKKHGETSGVTDNHEGVIIDKASLDLMVNEIEDVKHYVFAPNMNVRQPNENFVDKYCLCCLTILRKMSLFVFPVLFFSFGIFYFVVYFSLSTNHGQQKCEFANSY